MPTFGGVFDFCSATPESQILKICHPAVKSAAQEESGQALAMAHVKTGRGAMEPKSITRGEVVAIPPSAATQIVWADIVGNRRPSTYAIRFEGHSVGCLERAHDTQRHGSCRVCEDLAETAACRTHIEILQSTVDESLLYHAPTQCQTAGESQGPDPETSYRCGNRTT